MKHKIQEEINIERAKQHWEIIRKKKTVLKILNHVGGVEGTEKTFKLANIHMKHDEERISKFIIFPDNPHRLQWIMIL